MVDVFKEKEALTNELSDQYAKSLISLDEFESMIDQVNKVESLKQLNAVKKAVCENTGLMLSEDYKKEAKNPSLVTNSLATSSLAPGKVKKRSYETVFSRSSVVAEAINGHAGNFSCVFGTNQIKVNNLPMGKTVLKVETVFGLTEIFVSKKIKIVNKVTPIFAGVFMPADEEKDDNYVPEGWPELHIKGEAVFGNITIKRIE